MKRAIIALAIAGLSMAAHASPPAGGGVPTAAPEAAIHSRRVTASADGGICRQAGDMTRCRQFVATEYSEPSGKYRESVIRLFQWRSWSNGYGYRDLECMVDRTALKVLPNQAQVRADLDVDSERCYYNWGVIVTFEPYGEEPWPYTGIVDIDATLLDARFESRQLSNMRWEDRQTGESQREICHGASVWEPHGGGFTMLGLYFPFAPDAANGSFYYDNCGITNR